MVKTEKRCVTCELPCLGASCPNRMVEVHYCDNCNYELSEGEIYEVDDEELCEECLKERFLRRW